MNKIITLARRPEQIPDEKDFTIASGPIPEIKQGQILIKTLFLSADPYMRERMDLSKSYMPEFKLNEMITGTLVGVVIESKSKQFSIGDTVYGFLGWQIYNVSDGTNISKVTNKSIPPQTALGVLGSPGITAYNGLLEIGKPKKGETIVISGAAGAVGTLVGQIAKIYGCKVIGIVGSDEKCKYLIDELGFDACINYKTSLNIKEALEKICTNGIDLYYDNVGNGLLNDIIELSNKKARIILCGQISQYNGSSPTINPKILGLMTKKSITMQGFMIHDFIGEKSVRAIQQISLWIQQGQIQYRENVIEGIENAPKALIGLFTGQNIGKQLLKI